MRRKIFVGLRVVMGMLALIGALVVAPFLSAIPAFASTGESDLCSSFAGCAAAGYSNFGYSSAYNNSYWGQDAGHNCTNYVAYRFTAAGVAKPSWLGHGNAVDWGLWAPSSIVNTTPSVGAIAWWGPSSAYAQYGGHVSIVERVNPDGSFIDSDDNYQGDFHWREYTPGGTDWPTAFIHYDDAALRGGGTAPAITTTSLPTGQVGHDYSATLRASGGATPYAWSLSSGTLPQGLTLSSSGTISGIPAGPADTSVTVTVTGGDGASSSAILTIWIPAIAWGPTVSKAPGEIDTFFRTAGGCLDDAWWNPNANGVAKIACKVAVGAVATVSKAPSETDTYFRETNGCLYDAWWNPEASGVGRVACKVAADAIVSVSKAASETDTYFRETNGCLYDAWWNPAASGVARVACGVSAGAVAAVSKAPSETDTYFRETNGCLYDAWWNPAASGVGKVACAVSAEQ